jgi:hypothetical protein
MEKENDKKESHMRSNIDLFERDLGKALDGWDELLLNLSKRRRWQEFRLMWTINNTVGV